MLYVIISVVLFFILMLIAVRIGVRKEQTEKEEAKPLLHTSGIYSVVKRSPREDAQRVKPSEENIRKYLQEKNEDIKGNKLSDGDREALVQAFGSALDANTREVEDGDKKGCEFYYFEFEGDDAACAPFITKGQFVTREDIHKFAQLIPPFHVGCLCRLKQQHGNENMRETRALRLRPLLTGDSPVPQLPNWHAIVKRAP